MRNIFPLGLLYVLGKENEIKPVCVYLRKALFLRPLVPIAQCSVSDSCTVMCCSGRAWELACFSAGCSCSSSASGTLCISVVFREHFQAWFL